MTNRSRLSRSQERWRSPRLRQWTTSASESSRKRVAAAAAAATSSSRSEEDADAGREVLEAAPGVVGASTAMSDDRDECGPPGRRSRANGDEGNPLSFTYKKNLSDFDDESPGDQRRSHQPDE